VYQYCLDQKLVDAALIGKWKKPGYERLCSTYVINPANYKFGTTSICRVPWKDRSPEQRGVADPTTGCLGCASGVGGGPRNIFGSKYGQNLAAVQIAREKRQALAREKKEAAAAAAAVEAQQQQQQELAVTQKAKNDKGGGEASTDDDDDAETDDDTDDEDDYGPTPAAGIWAGSKKLEQESERIAHPNGDEEDEDDEEDGPVHPPKKARTNDSTPETN